MNTGEDIVVEQNYDIIKKDTPSENDLRSSTDASIVQEKISKAGPQKERDNFGVHK